MLDGAREKALIEGFFAVLRSGEVERLDTLVAEDCADADPLPLQLPGRAGVAQKIRLFRAAHPDARIAIESLAIESAASEEVAARSIVRATWTTTARGLGGAITEATWRFTGLFEIEAGKIRASRLLHSGAAG